MKFFATVLAVILVCLGAGFGPIYPAKAHDFEERPDYAILPGVSIGAVALGMPADLAIKAMARYGRVKQFAASESEKVYKAGEHFYVVLDLKRKGSPVKAVIAVGDSQFYIVVPHEEDGDNAHLLLANADNIIDAWGYSCSGGSVRLPGGMPALRGTWENYGSDVYVLPTPFGLFVVGASVYVAQAVTLDALHERTCGESEQ